MSGARTQTSIAKLVVDAAMTMGVMSLLTLALTGLAIHEWMGIGLLIVATVHLLLNWAWIAAGIRRFFGRMAPLVRFNAVLNIVLFVVMAIVLASGLMISAVALPFFGLRPVPSVFLRLVHQIFADALLLLVGVHVGMNWRSVVTSLHRVIDSPVGT